MTTGIIASSGQDFDNIFERGGGNQLFGIYGYDGQDIGQRYLPASYGQAYGNTGFQQAQGTDVGNLLCRAGTMNVYTVNIGKNTDIYLWGYNRGSFNIGSITPAYYNGYQIARLGSQRIRFDDYVLVLRFGDNAQPYNSITVTFLDNNTSVTLHKESKVYQSASNDPNSSAFTLRYNSGQNSVQVRIQGN